MSIPRRQSGFAIIAAIFLLVVLSGLIAYMMSIAAAQRQTTHLALVSARTLAAAKAGLEWGIYRRAGPPADMASPPAWASADCNGSLTVGGIAVEVSCTGVAVADGAVSRNRYTITAVAVSGSTGSADYVRKALTTTLLVP